MAAVATKLVTAEEFYEFVHRPENRDRFFELDRGEIVEMPPPMKYHGFVCASIVAILWAFAVRRKRGYPCSNDAGFIVERDPDTVRGPDISFYEDEQTPAEMPRQYSEDVPRLAIDVLSPNDRYGKTVRRVRQMLASGVPLIWIVDPEARNVTIHRPGQEPYVLEENQELTGEDVLPDFQCKVADFFRMPGE